MAMLDSLARHDPTAMVRYVLTRPDLATLVKSFNDDAK